METTKDGGGGGRGVLYLAHGTRVHGEQAPPLQTGAGGSGCPHGSEKNAETSSRTRGSHHLQKQDPGAVPTFASQ